MASLSDMSSNNLGSGKSLDVIELLCSDPIFFQASQSCSSVNDFISTLRQSEIEFSESDIRAFVDYDISESQDIMHSFSQFVRQVLSRINDDTELEKVSGGFQAQRNVNMGFGLANSLTSTGMQMGLLIQQANQSEELDKRREELQAKVEAFRASIEAKS